MKTTLRARTFPGQENDTFDLAIFFVLTMFTSVFTLGRFNVSDEPIQEGYTGFVLWGRIISYRQDQAMNVALFVASLVWFTLLAVLFLYRRYLLNKGFISHKLLAFFIGLILLRFVTYFSFPYGSLSFDFKDLASQKIFTIPYDGLSLYDRTISFFLDEMFLTYFLLFFTYFKTLTYRADVLTDILLFAFIGVALLMNLYTYCFQYNEIAFNLKNFFSDETPQMENIVSFTSHRNVYGFFLLMAGYASLILSFRRKMSPVFFGLIIYFLLTEFLIKCRSSLLMMVFLVLFYLIIAAVVSFKKRPVVFWLSLGSLIALVLVYLILVIFFRGTSFGKHLALLWHFFSDPGTIFSRLDLQERAVSMLGAGSNYLLFGFGKVSYIYLYNAFGTAMSAELQWFSHNGFIDVLVSYGLIYLLVLVAAYLYLCYQCLYLIQKKEASGYAYLGVLFLIIFYGFAESRILFGMDGSQVFFTLILLWPLTREYQDCRQQVQTSLQKIQ
jgi:hypothetical protein